MRESGLDKQNVMRLRINRIALVQELRVEHVLRYLTEAGIMTEDDLSRITSGSTPGDKARVLVDILTCEYCGNLSYLQYMIFFFIWVLRPIKIISLILSCQS